MNTFPAYRHGRTKYTGTSDRGVCSGIFSIFVLLCFLIIPPVSIILIESWHSTNVAALYEILDADPKPLTKEHLNNLSATGEDSLFHFQASVSSNMRASDEEMGVSLPESIQLRRRTEYCQWSESQRQACEKCTRVVQAKDGSQIEERYDCHCVTRYSYIKSWKSHTIPSILFDQFAAHNNPLRDPLPSAIFLTANTNMRGDDGLEVQISQKILKNARPSWRNVDWVPTGKAIPIPSIFSRKYWFGDTTRYEKMDKLASTQSSPAKNQHNFVFVGQGGYFYSPYHPSRTESLLKYFFQYMEGTLLDWQLGDLFPSCTPGDIRIYYQVWDPLSVSILARAKQISDYVVTLLPYQTKLGQYIGFCHAGRLSVDEMIQAEEYQSRYKANLARVFLLLWSIPSSHLMIAFFGREYTGHQGLSLLIASSMAIWLTFMGIIWTYFWGLTIDIIYSLVCVTCIFLYCVKHAPKARASGGIRAVWCMVGRWASLPPSWRMEDSYFNQIGEKVEFSHVKKTS